VCAGCQRDFCLDSGVPARIENLASMDSDNLGHGFVYHERSMKAKVREAEIELTPRVVFDELDRFVVGQERAKRTVAIAAYNHVKRCSLRNSQTKSLLRKSNILMVGPTGCGKTHIARNLARILDVPITIADATEYTEAGYYGKDIEVMVGELLFKADHDIEAAQKGIIFVDEIDKIARRSHGARTGAGSRDIGGEGVQQSVLKLLEGRDVYVPLNVTQHWNKHDFVQMDTRDILFICAGTFSDLRPYDEREQPAVGFANEAAGAAKRKPITRQELLQYGFMAELLGRIPTLVELDPLSEDQLLEVLTVPPDAIIREYVANLQIDGVELEFEEGALRAMVRYAVDESLGARGLRTVVEAVCHDIMFEAPERRGETITIDVDYAKEHLANATVAV
jgi:ATP-dependent Clp protease ATP-binding subunit ClpX